MILLFYYRCWSLTVPDSRIDHRYICVGKTHAGVDAPRGGRCPPVSWLDRISAGSGGLPCSHAAPNDGETSLGDFVM